MSERRVHEVSGRSIAVLATAIVVAAVLMPAGVMAATGSFVNVRDPWNTGTSGQARVVNNKLATETCDIGSTTANTSTCARVDAGKLRVGDGSGALTVEQTIPTTPHAASCNGSAGEYSFYPSCTFQVPAGKRFAITTVSTYAAIPNAQDIVLAYVVVTTNGTSRSYYFPMTYEVTYPGNNLMYFTGNPDLSLYADAASTVKFEIFRSAYTGTASVGVAVSGYLA